MRVRVTLTSDFICPWCFIGKSRLAKAIASVPAHARVDLVWHP
jgi:predicted DsbA family dithiol-disulfide isomerase